MAVVASFGADDYIAAKEGLEPVIHDCPYCDSSNTFVQNSEVNMCFDCGFVLDESCSICGTSLTLEEYTMLDNGYCGSCSYGMARAMRD